MKVYMFLHNYLGIVIFSNFFAFRFRDLERLICLIPLGRIVFGHFFSLKLPLKINTVH
jgi:hypothetical protein